MLILSRAHNSGFSGCYQVLSYSPASVQRNIVDMMKVRRLPWPIVVIGVISVSLWCKGDLACFIYRNVNLNKETVFFHIVV